MADSQSTAPVYGATNPDPRAAENAEGTQRFGSVIGLKPEMEALYRELHANAWDAVLARLASSHIQNYSIYITELEGKKYLFSYFEYTGVNFEQDMAEVAADPATQRWWQETDPCQNPLPGREAGANWRDMESVFYMP